LFWTLYFLKNYPSEDTACSRWKTTRKTYRKWIWRVLDALFFSLPFTVNFNNRFKGWTNKCPSFILDCTECAIVEPSDIEWEYYSKKKQCHTVKYELGISMTTHQIIWIHGPFKGSVHDMKIFHLLLDDMIGRDGEMAMGDKGYIGACRVLTPFKPPRNHSERLFNKKHYAIRSDVERTIKRIKVFNILKSKFRHSLGKHKIIFHVCSYITNLSFIYHPQPTFGICPPNKRIDPFLSLVVL